MALVRIRPEDPRWLELATSTNDATAFHHPAWAKAISRAYGYEAFLLAAERGDGTLAAGVPVIDATTRPRGRRWVSLPFTDMCTPLFGGHAEPVDLVRDLDQERAEANIAQFEIRSYLPGLRVQPRLAGVTHVLPLDRDLDGIRKGFRHAVRKNIAAAEKKGIVVRRAESRDDVTSTFYALHLATRRRQGVPIQPRRFFEALWEEVLSQDVGFCLLAYDGDRPIGGAVFLQWQRTLTAKYSASDQTALASRPNNILQWEAIKHGLASGLDVFDFGRTDIAQTGLRDFKLSWGCREELLLYSTIGRDREASASGALSSALGAVIRHSPAGFCKLVGNALYRYAA